MASDEQFEMMIPNGTHEDIEIKKDDSSTDKLPSFLEFSSNVDMHGYGHISNSKGIRKLLWIVLYVGGIVFSVVLVRDAIYEYSNFTIYLETKEFKFPLNDMNFPSITICNKVPITQKSYERVRKIVNITELEYEEFYTRYLTRYRHKVAPNPAVERKIIDALARNNYTQMEDVFELFEINTKDMFENPVSKMFLTTMPGDPDYPTCRFDYRYRSATKRVFSVKESMCHQINFYEEGKEPRKGWRYNVKSFGNMIAVVNTDRSSPFNRTLKLRSQAPYMDLVDGLVIYIHAYGNLHENSPVTERIFLKPGKWHFLKIDYKEVHHQPPPYTHACGSKPYRLFKSNFNYTRAMCYTDCQIAYRYKVCGCVSWEFRGYVDVPICNLTSSFCFINQRSKSINACKNEKCPYDCIENKYNVHTETLDLIDEQITDRALTIPGWKLNREETSDYISSNIVGVQVMYTNVAKLEYHQPAIKWIDLIATLGGNLGLCTGFSIVVVFEFLQYAFDYIILVIQRRKKMS